MSLTLTSKFYRRSVYSVPVQVVRLLCESCLSPSDQTRTPCTHNYRYHVETGLTARQQFITVNHEIYSTCMSSAVKEDTHGEAIRLCWYREAVAQPDFSFGWGTTFLPFPFPPLLFSLLSLSSHYCPSSLRPYPFNQAIWPWGRCRLCQWLCAEPGRQRVSGAFLGKNCVSPHDCTE